MGQVQRLARQEPRDRAKDRALPVVVNLITLWFLCPKAFIRVD